MFYRIGNEIIRSQTKGENRMMKLEKKQVHWYVHIIWAESDRLIKVIHEKEKEKKRKRGRIRHGLKELSR